MCQIATTPIASTTPLISMTETVKLPSPCISKVITTKRQALQKKVQFAPKQIHTVGYTLSRSDITEAEKAECWWSRQDKSTIQKMAKVSICRFRKRERYQHAAALLDEMVRTLADLSLSMNAAHEMEFMRNPCAYVPHLAAWSKTELAAECCGLERYVSASTDVSAHFTERKMWRQNIVRMHALGVGDEEIADIYRAASMEARLGARILAHTEELVSTTSTAIQQQTSKRSFVVERVSC